MDGNVRLPDPIEPTNNELLTQLALTSTDEPLTLYLVGSSPAPGRFSLQTDEDLDIEAVGIALGLHAQTAPTLVVIDCDRAAAIAQALYEAAGSPTENLLLLTSTGSGSLSISIFSLTGDSGVPVSFSDFFWDQVSSSATVEEAFRIALERLLELQGPLVLQIPEIIPVPAPEAMLGLEVGSPFVEDLRVADVPDNNDPSFLRGPPSTNHVRDQPLTLEAKVSDDGSDSSTVMAHISLRDDASVYAERAMVPVEDASGTFELTVDRFPASLFDPGIAAAADYLVSLLAEDGDRNSADPYLTSVLVDTTDLFVDGFDDPQVLVTPVTELEGTLELGAIPARPGSEAYTDGEGLRVTVVPGESVGMLIDNLLELDSTGPVRFAINVHASAPGAFVALAVFNITPSSEPDGRLAYNLARGDAIPVDTYTTLDLLYDPPDDRGFVYLQVFQPHTGENRIEVSFDNLVVDPSPDLARSGIELDFDADFSEISDADLGAGGLYLTNLNATDTGAVSIENERLILELGGSDLAANFGAFSFALGDRLPGLPILFSAESDLIADEPRGFVALMLIHGDQDLVLFQNAVDITPGQRIEVGGTILRPSSVGMPPLFVIQNADPAGNAVSRLEVDTIQAQSFSLAEP